jgi:ATP:cob(I)alamin adenosyltransferase
MKISTGTGDQGQTGTFGGGRVDKDDVRMECIGTIDECNSSLGLLRASLHPDHPWQKKLRQVQNDMMAMMSHIATPGVKAELNRRPHPTKGPDQLNRWNLELEESLREGTDWFLLPGGNQVSAQCHVIRTQVRRAERRLVSLRKSDPPCVRPYMLVYLNRLSDTLFLMARKEMQESGVPEERWKRFKNPVQQGRRSRHSPGE